jgi:hypothetical protein
MAKRGGRSSKAKDGRARFLPPLAGGLDVYVQPGGGWRFGRGLRPWRHPHPLDVYVEAPPPAGEGALAPRQNGASPQIVTRCMIRVSAG